MKKLALLIGIGIAALGGAQDAAADTTCKLECDAEWQDCLADHHTPKTTCVYWHKQCYAECGS